MTNQAISTQEALGKFRKQLNSRREVLFNILPTHIDVKKISEMAATEVANNPYLLSLDRGSLLSSVVQAAKLGLEIGNGLGHAYLVPFGNKCQLIVGYRGMLELARRSKQIKQLTANVVREKDLFEYEYGFETKLKHIKTLKGPGEVICAYSGIVTTDGGRYLEVMSLEEIRKIQLFSESKRKNVTYKNPWRDYFDQMAIKTVIRRQLKFAPTSIEVEKAIILDELGESGQQPNILEGEFDNTQNEKEALPSSEKGTQEIIDKLKVSETEPTTDK